MEVILRQALILRRALWGRMASCGGPTLSKLIGLHAIARQARPIDNRPQISNLPHMLLALVVVASALQAETGRDAWLRYAGTRAPLAAGDITTTADSPVMASARAELMRGMRSEERRVGKECRS